MFSGTAQVLLQICQYFVSSVCVLVLVIIVDKNKAVVCCLLATSATLCSVSQTSGKDLYASVNARAASLLFILER